MSLTLRTRSRAGVVAGYEVVASTTERAGQIDTYAVALHHMVPSGIFNETAEPYRQAMASLSLLLAALLEGWDGDKQQALQAIKGINAYLVTQRSQLMQAERLDEFSAGIRLVPGFDYFGYDWERLLHGV